MAKFTRKRQGPTSVEPYTDKDQRVNIPAEEMRDFSAGSFKTRRTG